MPVLCYTCSLNTSIYWYVLALPIEPAGGQRSHVLREGTIWWDGTCSSIYLQRCIYLMNTFCDFIASCAGTCGCLTMWYIDADGDES